MVAVDSGRRREVHWSRRHWLLAAGGLLLGCQRKQKTPLVSVTPIPRERPPEQSLSPAWSPKHRIEVPRTVLECPAGDCILVHFPIRKDYVPDGMTDLLAGQAGTTEDDGELFESARWTGGPPGRLCQFNCCAFAVGDWIGLGPTDWLCGEVSGLTDGSNPMHVMLKSFFRQIAEFPPPFATSGIEAFATDSRLQDEDVVCLVGSRGPDFPHAMRVKRRKGRNWVLGKFGEDPILWTPLETVGGAYEGQFDQVQVFRFQGEQSPDRVG